MGGGKQGFQLLVDLGFVECGRWLLREGELVADLASHGCSTRVLYAFVSEGEVLYIGKTSQSLSARLQGYECPGPSQWTNIRNNEAIIELLRVGADVRIMVFTESEPMHFRGLRVNLAAGLEDELIKRIMPLWNRQGKGASSRNPGGTAEAGSPHNPDMDVPAPTWAAIRATLKPADVINNWSVASGYTGGSFTVVRVSRDQIVVKPPAAIHLQEVPRDDFERVLGVWTRYLNREVKRYQLRELTRYSTYIISILHHVMNRA